MVSIMDSVLHVLELRDDGASSNDAAPTTISFDNDMDKRGSIICASVISVFFAVLTTVLRVVARRKVGAPLKSDDYWIFIGCFMAVNVVASTIAMTNYGLGLHIQAVTNPQGLAVSVLLSQVFYSLSVPTIKISILYLYHRIFPSKTLRNISIAIATAIVLYSAIFIILLLAQCIPLSHLWEPSNQATCIDINLVYIIMAILNVLTDLLILALPIKYVWALEMPRIRKLQIVCIFLLGSCASAFGIVRAVFVARAGSRDISFQNVPSAIWSEVEICVGVVSANLPCLRPLVRKLPKGLGGGSSTGPAAPGNAAYGHLAYGRSAKRASKGLMPGIEMDGRRRPRSGWGTWEEIEEERDVRSFARGASTPRYSRGLSRIEAALNQGVDKAFEKGIFVETTVEVQSVLRK